MSRGMADAGYWASLVRAQIRKLAERPHPDLERELEKLPQKALIDFHRMMQDLDERISRQERTRR